MIGRLYGKTFQYLSSVIESYSVKSNNKRSKSNASSEQHDSAVYVDELSWTNPPSRSDSLCSVCSCMGCSSNGGEWQRRPSRLLEGYDVEDFYRIGEVLGEGSFSTVYLAESLTYKGGWVAIKEVQKSNLLQTKKLHTPGHDDKGDSSSSEDELVSRSVMDLSDREIMHLIDKEISIMSALDHPHVIHLEEVYEDDDKVCFVMELAKGGEVFDRLVEQVSFDEVQTADLIVQLLCSVGYIHSKGIVHRDLKLENLLYYSDSEESKIMVADFGLSDWLKDLEAEGGATICGTPGYMAPEVINRKACTAKADVWAIGVITYILLAGYPPFYVNSDDDEEDEALLNKILKGDFDFVEATWKHISPAAIDFIQSLMCSDPNERPSCEEALAHPWLNDRQRLEQSAADRARLQQEPPLFNWSMTQKVAFALSLVVMFGSYSALITYVFGIGRPAAILQQAVNELTDVYNKVYFYLDQATDIMTELFNAIKL